LVLIFIISILIISVGNVECYPNTKPFYKWFYVGGDGPGNYTEIQDAVDNASNGDTIYVYHGIYNQDPNKLQEVRIFKSIHLLGENKNNTILNGTKAHDVLRLLAGNVEISGFTIQNAGTGDVPGAAIDAYKSDGMGTIKNISIHDSIITKNDVGMAIADCFNISIYNNIFIHDGTALSIMSSSNSSITNNYFINDRTGLFLYYEYTITISHNEFRENTVVGLNYQTCKGLTIHANNFINNKIQAKFLKSGGLRELRTVKALVQNWTQNYWSDWNSTDPRPIRGTAEIYFGLSIGLIIPINFHAREYDLNPAQTPYSI
jgi:parallel beta-helix repeat protein